MQNKAKVKYTKINVSSVNTMRYAKVDNWLFRQTKPIQTQFKANLSQNKPNLSQNKANSNPIKANLRAF
jgi:hypothetical protein